jgi:SAM-dependent methyltransferase
VTDRSAVYAFGRDDRAARRLALVHALLEPTSRALLEALADERSFDVATDLGCGPGLTSAMLDRALRPAALVGLDLSEPFLERARTAVPHGRFHRHDLRRLPWPGAPADLVYARYVLTHLPDPEARLAEWLTQARPGGLLVLEENEWIDCRQPALGRYLAMVEALLARRGHDLQVGRRLAAAAGGRPGMTRVVEAPGATGPVATMFRLNLAAWGPEADPAEVARLDGELAALEPSEARGEITWGIRQLVLERPG